MNEKLSHSCNNGTFIGFASITQLTNILFNNRIELCGSSGSHKQSISEFGSEGSNRRRGPAGRVISEAVRGIVEESPAAPAGGR